MQGCQRPRRVARAADAARLQVRGLQQRRGIGGAGQHGACLGRVRPSALATQEHIGQHQPHRAVAAPNGPIPHGPHQHGPRPRRIAPHPVRPGAQQPSQAHGSLPGPLARSAVQRGHRGGGVARPALALQQHVGQRQRGAAVRAGPQQQQHARRRPVLRHPEASAQAGSQVQGQAGAVGGWVLGHRPPEQRVGLGGVGRPAHAIRRHRGQAAHPGRVAQRDGPAEP